MKNSIIISNGFFCVYPADVSILPFFLMNDVEGNILVYTYNRWNLSEQKPAAKANGKFATIEDALEFINHYAD